MKKIIAIDFDDTLTEFRPFPEVAPFRKEIFEYIPLLAEKYTLVLWTARRGIYYDECVDRLKKAGLLRYIALDDESFKHGKTGKLEADYYIDDKANFGIIDWKQIYKKLMEE